MEISDCIALFCLILTSVKLGYNIGKDVERHKKSRH